MTLEEPPSNPESSDPPPPEVSPRVQSSGPRKRRNVVALVAVLLFFGLAFYLVFHQGEENSQAPGQSGGFGPVTLTAEMSQQSSIGIYLSAIGTVTPVYTASIVSQAAGVVRAVHYKEGQLVAKGDLLIDVDPRIYQAQVVESQGTLKKDSEVLAQAKMDLERYRAAWARNAIPKQTLDDQEMIALQDEGKVKNDQGTLQYNQVLLSYCHIVAPISGRIGLRLIDPGNVLTADGTTVLAVITQVDPITVIFTLPEDDLDKLHAQTRQGKALSVDAFDGIQQDKIASGKLLTIDNQIDLATGTVKLRALFDNKKGVLFPNQSVDTKLLVKTLNGVVLVPTNAIQHNEQEAFVYAIEGGRAMVRNVKPGVSDAGKTAVEGIDAGIEVATSSFEKLQDGVQATIWKTPAGSNGAESHTP